MSKDSIIDSNDIILKKDIIKEKFSLKNITNSTKYRHNDKHIIVDCENPIVIEQKIHNNYYPYSNLSFINEFNNFDIHPDVCKCISIFLFFFILIIFTLFYRSTYNT